MSRIAAPWPLEIRLNPAKRQLTIIYDTGRTVALKAELLRTQSPSAEVQGHAPNQKILVTGKENVRIEKVEAVGNYAIRLTFDDGHDTGLFTWDYLYSLGA